MRSQAFLLKKIRWQVQTLMQGEGTGHDWWHAQRVRRLALRIATKEAKADKLVVELGALLHDVADWKFHKGSQEAGPRVAARLLKAQGASAALIDRVGAIVREISFKGAGVKDKPSSLEARIVKDADRLDALGALGIARAFAYGGSKRREIYNPSLKPVKHRSFAAYRRAEGSTINHFYEKLLLLKGRMHTRLARNLAVKRHRYMEDYLRHFYREWKGLD